MAILSFKYPYNVTLLHNLFTFPSADEVRPAAPGGRPERAVCHRWRQHPRRVPHQRPQPLGSVREPDEGPSGARPQRDGDHGVSAEIAVGQLHRHRRVCDVAVRGEHARHRYGPQIPDQRVR